MATRLRMLSKAKVRNPTLSQQLAASLTACKLTFKLKAGMTISEANDAIDAGFDRWAKCMRSKLPPSRRPPP